MLPGARARIGGKAEMESLKPARLYPARFVEPCFDLRKRVRVPAFAQCPAEMDAAIGLPQLKRLVFRKPQRLGRPCLHPGDVAGPDVRQARRGKARCRSCSGGRPPEPSSATAPLSARAWSWNPRYHKVPRPVVHGPRARIVSVAQPEIPVGDRVVDRKRLLEELQRRTVVTLVEALQGQHPKRHAARRRCLAPEAVSSAKRVASSGAGIPET